MQWRCGSWAAPAAEGEDGSARARQALCGEQAIHLVLGACGNTSERRWIGTHGRQAGYECTSGGLLAALEAGPHDDSHVRRRSSHQTAAAMPCAHGGGQSGEAPIRARLMAAGRDYSATAVKAALLTERISPGERDRAGMVHYRGDGSVLPAIIGNYANRYLIGGHGARSGTWVGAVQKDFFACGALQVACGAL